MKTTLEKTPLYTCCTVENINCTSQIKTRLQDLGIIPTTTITPILKSICSDPIAYEVRGTMLAIRNDDAKKISISY